MTEDDFIKRHVCCVSPKQVRTTVEELKRQGKIDENGCWKASGRPFSMKAACEHEEDGYCGTDMTPEAIRKLVEAGVINSRKSIVHVESPRHELAVVLDMPKLHEVPLDSIPENDEPEELPDRFTVIDKGNPLNDALNRIAALASKK